MLSARTVRLMARQIEELQQAGVRMFEPETGECVFDPATGHQGELRRVDRLQVEVKGPRDTPYEGATWRVSLQLPPEYPYKSPSVAFVERIWHANINSSGGAVCLNVLNQAWTATMRLLQLVDTVLPALLAAPNPSDPFNSEAARQLGGDGGVPRPDGEYWREARVWALRYAFSHAARSDAGSSSARETRR
jgi:ubiquitin-conjugating enzyme E2 H